MFKQSNKIFVADPMVDIPAGEQSQVNVISHIKDGNPSTLLYDRSQRARPILPVRNPQLSLPCLAQNLDGWPILTDYTRPA